MDIKLNKLLNYVIIARLRGRYVVSFPAVYYYDKIFSLSR